MKWSKVPYLPWCCSTSSLSAFLVMSQGICLRRYTTVTDSTACSLIFKHWELNHNAGEISHPATLHRGLSPDGNSYMTYRSLFTDFLKQSLHQPQGDRNLDATCTLFHCQCASHLYIHGIQLKNMDWLKYFASTFLTVVPWIRNCQLETEVLNVPSISRLN